MPEGTTLAGRARELERDLRLMGPINPLALEEHSALQERHQFLADQLEDVKSSRRELNRVIRAVDREIVAVFEQAFHDVSEHFTALFTTLFPGGSGRVSLIDPDDMLDTGIEIEARPSGKNVRRLSLLSGGERSLTALAFLFAVFRARPSPFYLLDEVEAALDDVNLHRFLDLIHEFRDEAQLLIVTHQKRTMEAGDVLVRRLDAAGRLDAGRSASASPTCSWAQSGERETVAMITAVELPARLAAAGRSGATLSDACGTRSERNWLCTTTFRITGSKGVGRGRRCPVEAVADRARVVLAYVSRRHRAAPDPPGHGAGARGRFAVGLLRRRGLEDDSSMLAMRRAQRAETISSVLRNVSSVVIWSIALLIVLGELGVDLAPLLAGRGDRRRRPRFRRADRGA